ncbi:gamma-glutamyl-gamma-aminobutyrate hydrolase family protein [Clostridium sp. MB40-C1]|uniref:gamma-glutamyl-gamma-aminobutyrate hydrolase family protein n=1 Tax=Clostridium sp. MB40-C1 TaxID=3070996 RepID=UPI0027E14D37|nr:gamma-glutamyl-gamma-aminobutyrate hydrolase family protein [Clostridium sp. MB40-C1]WMJ81321.1 gamma-glutamyl-gamma-aminobutyrate hydrolase family protein [Clostridium sp. MB40-C1]
MKLIGITQRVEFIEDYNEKRDCLDKKWSEFLLRCNLIPVILPNNIECAKNIIRSINLDGFLFTGGNNLVKYGGQEQERDNLERFCMNYAIENRLPIIGVCRGMQFIQDYFGVNLEKLHNHVAVEHEIKLGENNIVVNSYHSWGAKDTVSDLIVKACSKDKVIEAVKHKYYDIYGIMWHPERVSPFSESDIEFFEKAFLV